MKKTYHICLSAGNEVYCRDEEDHIRYFNSLALAVAQSDSSLLAESIMSNHVHECVRTEYPGHLITLQRYKYSRYFNAKYHRRGSLGERFPFILELQGLYHTLAALSYVLRNAVHHGIAPTPFAYPHSSAGAIFRHDLGRQPTDDILPERCHRRHIPSHNKCPAGYRMSSSGLILREDVVDTADVEHLYGTPRSFLYYMNRLSGEEWVREQEKDKEASSPITLSCIERGIEYQTIEHMLANEHGRSNYKRMTDIELCTLIDKVMLPDMGRVSVYMLSYSEKSMIADRLYRELRLPVAQIKRCMAIP